MMQVVGLVDLQRINNKYSSTNMSLLTCSKSNKQQLNVPKDTLKTAVNAEVKIAACVSSKYRRAK